MAVLPLTHAVLLAHKAAARQATQAAAEAGAAEALLQAAMGGDAQDVAAPQHEPVAREQDVPTIAELAAEVAAQVCCVCCQSISMSCCAIGSMMNRQGRQGSPHCLLKHHLVLCMYAALGMMVAEGGATQDEEGCCC